MFACSPADTATDDGHDSTEAPKLKIVTSFLPIDAHVRRVVGDGAHVQMLLDSDSGPHDFQLKPSKVRTIAQADMLVINGMGIEDWLEPLLNSAASQSLILVDTSKDSEKISDVEALLSMDTHSHGHSHSHSHCHSTDGNPHIWLDPLIAQSQVRVILDAVSQADPARAGAFAANAAVYLTELEELHRSFQQSLADLPNKNLITFHDAFPYFARRYDLNYLGFVEAFPEKDPSPAHLRRLIELIGKHQVGVIFAESGFSPKLMETIAAQTGSRIMVLDTLEAGEPDADAYLQRMRTNLETLRQAWQD